MQLFREGKQGKGALLEFIVQKNGRIKNSGDEKFFAYATCNWD